MNWTGEKQENIRAKGRCYRTLETLPTLQARFTFTFPEDGRPTLRPSLRLSSSSLGPLECHAVLLSLRTCSAVRKKVSDLAMQYVGGATFMMLRCNQSSRLLHRPLHKI